MSTFARLIHQIVDNLVTYKRYRLPYATQLKLSAGDLQALDDLRVAFAHNGKVPTRAEAARMAIEKAWLQEKLILDIPPRLVQDASTA